MYSSRSGGEIHGGMVMDKHIQLCVLQTLTPQDALSSSASFSSVRESDSSATPYLHDSSEKERSFAPFLIHVFLHGRGKSLLVLNWLRARYSWSDSQIMDSWTWMLRESFSRTFCSRTKAMLVRFTQFFLSMLHNFELIKFKCTETKRKFSLISQWYILCILEPPSFNGSVTGKRVLSRSTTRVLPAWPPRQQMRMGHLCVQRSRQNRLGNSYRNARVYHSTISSTIQVVEIRFLGCLN